MTARRWFGLSFVVAGAGCSLDWAVIDDPVGVPPTSIVEARHDPRSSSSLVDAASVSDGSRVLDQSSTSLDGGEVERPLSLPGCDLDEAGFGDQTRCPDASGPWDCDDHDPRAHPGQSFLDDPASAPLAGDWNCANGVEKLYAANVNCGVLAVGACSGVQGFTGDPACGATGAFVRCEVEGVVLCAAGTPSARTQSCK